MNTQREFVQIPERQLVDVALKFATGMQRDGQFGPYFLYTVVHEGKEKILKVTERLEKQFRKHDVKAGQVVCLLKETIQPQQGEPFTRINILEVKDSLPADSSAGASAKAEQPAPLRPEKPTNSTLPPVPLHEGFSGDTAIMYQSLVDAVDITRTIKHVEWRNTDIEKIGVCLFLSRTGHLTSEQVLANGNGNGNGKRTRRSAPKAQKTEPAAEKTNAATNQEIPVAEAVGAEKDDLPF